MKKRFLSLFVALALCLSATPPIRAGAVEETPVEAVPTTQNLNVRKYGGGGDPHAGEKIPMYSIIQDNGFGANYVKLRDIAYFVDFDVVWDASKPNEMRIYTDRHYLDPLSATGPATETKMAIKSTMDIYIDDVKADVDAYMIDNNNYFKIRDLAKAVGFGCIYNPKTGNVGLDAKYPYQDGDKTFTDKNYPTKRVINYQPTWYYDASSGTLMDTPDVNKALSLRNPTARMNYWEELVGEDVKRWLQMDDKPAAEFNARVQVLADMNKIVPYDTETIEVTLNGVPNKLNINPHYIYPVSPYAIDSTYYEETSSIKYKQEMNAAQENATNYCAIIVPKSTNNNHRMLKENNFHETLLGMQRDTAHILAKLDNFNSDREKIRYLGEQVCVRMDYAEKGETLPEGMGALNDGSFWAGWPTDNVAAGICETYVRAFERICVAAGYDYVRLMNATHVWDIVFVPDEAKWVVVDCTFADGPDYNNVPSMTQEYYDKYLCGELSEYDDAVNCLNVRGDSLTQKTLIETAYRIRREGL